MIQGYYHFDFHSIEIFGGRFILPTLQLHKIWVSSIEFIASLQLPYSSISAADLLQDSLQLIHPKTASRDSGTNLSRTQLSPTAI